MQYEIKQTSDFSNWLLGLKDGQGQTRILARIKLAAMGNFGDCKPIGDGLSEMRINVGPGYRVYFGQLKSVIYLLINGGNKGSQKHDIAKAKRFWAELKDGNYEETED
ncbi:MAG: type II toxin-antitoxin system RelE/ParE family toxin [Candidatus Adiutrix sp.]|jgi:putative addiction module killer protein|nr:type II toxin-antitoxin system RelE/ParE family toxin [Candidatus Adiutrix sp.]